MSDSPMRLVYVEEHHSVRRSVLAQMHRSPHMRQVLVADSSEAAVALTQAERPDLVLFGPQTIGPQALGAVQALMHVGRPVVVQVPSLAAYDEEHLRALGAAAVLLKMGQVRQLPTQLLALLLGTPDTAPAACKEAG